MTQPALPNVAAPTAPEFPRVFWIANFMELLERAAFYGFYIAITLYLTDLVGFTDKETGIVVGVFVALMYFLTPFVGAISDSIGFKKGLIIAFVLLTAGYTLLGLFHTKMLVIGVLFMIAVGGSFIKPLISGTIAKVTTQENRARGFALFYWVVNIGSFSGKTFVPFIRIGAGLEYVNFFSAGMSLIALVFALIFFKQEEVTHKGKSVSEVARSLVKVLTNLRLLALILIVAGFWTTQYQLYATMPKYVIRLLGEDSKPEWIANINPLIVVLFVVLITKLMSKRKAATSIFVGMLLVPVAALVISLGQMIENSVGPSLSVFGLFSLHPLTLTLIVGIALQGFAESFISPRYLEYFSLQAPKGEEGTYLGFGYLYSFFAAIAGFILSGFLLDKYCPDPKTLPAGLTAIQRAAYYQDAGHIWYYFIGIGLVTACSLLIYTSVVNRNDAFKAGTAS
ncbi:MAG: MFS transporter [Ignavibacteriales bacterium]|nr:MFS transporter [Ignavibacteriales bacterium]